MYTIALDAECLSVISRIAVAVQQYGQDHGVNTAPVLAILNQFEAQSTESPVQAGLLIDQKLQACDALQKQLVAVQKDQHELINESMNKLRFCLQNQKRNLMPSLLLEKIIGCYAGSIAADGSVTALEARKQQIQEMISHFTQNENFLVLVKNLSIEATQYVTFQQEIASAYRSVYGEDGDGFGEVEDLTQCPDLLARKNKLFPRNEIFSNPKDHIVTQLMGVIQQQAGLSAKFKKTLDDIERVTELANRNRACEITFEAVTSRLPVCDSQQALQLLCRELNSLNASLKDYAAIAETIPNDIPEAKAEVGLKEMYAEAAEHITAQLVSVRETRVDMLNHYIDSQLTGNNLSESIYKYGLALRTAIESLADDDPLRAGLQSKAVILDNLLAKESFIPMCKGIEDLAQHGDKMVSHFFTVGTFGEHGAKTVCSQLSQALKAKVIASLQGTIPENDLAQAIADTAMPVIVDMKNRNVFTKVAKFLAGIIEFIGRCAGYQPDFFKPKRKALADAVVTEANNLNHPGVH